MPATPSAATRVAEPTQLRRRGSSKESVLARLTDRPVHSGGAVAPPNCRTVTGDSLKSLFAITGIWDLLTPKSAINDSE